MHFLLTNYKIYKGFAINDDTNDEKLSMLLTGVEDFLKQQYQIYLQVYEISETHLVNSDIIVVGSTVNEVVSIVDKNNQIIPLDNVEWFDNIIYLNYDFNGKLKITYITGYTQIPEALQLAIFLFVDKLFEDIENNSNLIDRFSDPVAGRQTFIRSIPKEVNKLLSPFISYKIG